MPFVDLPDGTGKVYVPEKKQGCRQKHPCPDCFSCQMCSDDRCDRCRGAGEKSGRCCRAEGLEKGGDGEGGTP